MGVRSVSAFVYVPEEAGACAWRIMFSDSERSPSASPSVNKHRRADRPSQKQPNTPERVGQGRALEPPPHGQLLWGTRSSDKDGDKWSLISNSLWGQNL